MTAQKEQEGQQDEKVDISAQDDIKGKEFVFGWAEDDFIICEKTVLPLLQV